MIKLENERYFESSTIGEFQSKGKWIHPDIKVPTYELIFVLDGEVHIAEEDKEYTLFPNELIILDPNKRHFGFKESKNYTSFYWFHFYTNMEIPYKTYKFQNFYDIKYLLKRLLHISNTPTYSKGAIDSAGLMVFEELLSLAAAETQSNSALISNILEYVRINKKSNVTVKEVAEHFGYNSDYIGKLFKEHFDTGLKSFIAAERMKLAKDMLFTTNMTVKQIGLSLGFPEENSFIKFFTYHEHISPTKFRDGCSNTHINNI